MQRRCPLCGRRTRTAACRTASRRACGRTCSPRPVATAGRISCCARVDRAGSTAGASRLQQPGGQKSCRHRPPAASIRVTGRILGDPWFRLVHGRARHRLGVITRCCAGSSRMRRPLCVLPFREKFVVFMFEGPQFCSGGRLGARSRLASSSM